MGDTAQLLIFTCSDVLTGVYWSKLHQFVTWCRNQRQQEVERERDLATLWEGCRKAVATS